MHTFVRFCKIIYFFLCFFILFVMCSCSDAKRNYSVAPQTQSTDSINKETAIPTSTNSDPAVTAKVTASPEFTATLEIIATPTSTPTLENTVTPGNTSTPVITAKPEVTGTPSPATTTSPSCSHANITIKNKEKATCTKTGYSGDTYCVNCNAKISSGSKIPATGHTNTGIRNRKEATTSQAGYTGDTYCKDCGTKVASGSVIPKKENPNAGKVEYILPDGSSAFVDANIKDVTGYFMAQKTQKTSHLYLDVEKEIVRLCNIERGKENLSSLEWFEDAYYFAKIRAEEIVTLFSHTRPNGKPWYSVCFDAGLVITGYYGENLGKTIGATPDQFAKAIVDSWMNSPLHKENIMNGNYKRIAVAIVQNGDELTAVQFFFS